MSQIDNHLFIVLFIQISHSRVYVCFYRDLKLRNYTPEDEELKERQVPKAKPASGENLINCAQLHFLIKTLSRTTDGRET